MPVCARIAPLMYLMPPVAGLVAWLFAGEQYTGIKLGACAALTLPRAGQNDSFILHAQPLAGLSRPDRFP
ncbi:hypothetical protein [Polaromonas sp.]|uniref:hypothetical protein n=1 Tax=Polaromonas sp. TaxID=1869339 RepID=UPI0025E7A963|nr:hypothetical protein [Polaromonas sp.]